MYYYLFILLFKAFGLAENVEDDNIITVEKKIKIHHFHLTKIVSYKIDTCTFYFDAHHFISEVHINEGKHEFHAPLLKDLTLLFGQKDTVDLSAHKYTTIVKSLVNDALEKGFYKVYFSGKEYHGKAVLNIEYWDKDVHNKEYKHSNFYRPDTDIFMLPEGEIFYYYKPSIKRAVHNFRD